MPEEIKVNQSGNPREAMQAAINKGMQEAGGSKEWVEKVLTENNVDFTQMDEADKLGIAMMKMKEKYGVQD